MIRSLIFALTLPIISCSMLLTSCGGGGGSSSSGDTGGGSPTTGSAPATPENVTVSSDTDGEVIVNWDLVDSATSYNIYVATISSVASLAYDLKFTGITEPPYTITGLDNSTTYAVYVSAVNEYGESDNVSEPGAITPGAGGSTDGPLSGCTDPTATNYDETATVDDGGCTYTIEGCTDPLAVNYDETATVDDGGCAYPIAGCTDPLAVNYDKTADTDDGGCIYIVNGECGKANGGSYSTIPEKELCTTGAASTVTLEANGWIWTCAGENGGTDISCRADKGPDSDNVCEIVTCP